MQSLGFLDWSLIVLICVITAAAAVYWLTPPSPSIGPGVALMGNPGLRDAVFLFDGPVLIDASSAARTLIRDDFTGFDWARLRASLVAKYPGFPKSPGDIQNQKTLTIAADNKQSGAVFEWIDGIVRVQLRAERQPKARTGTSVRELEMPRLAMGNAPYPVWHIDSDGHISWHNTAYDALRRKVAKKDSELSAPIFLSLPQDDPKGRKNRASVTVQGTDQKLWFDVSVVRQDTGMLCYAVDINAVVDAEIAQRNFVQTLAKTFAQLSIGLAIFDRNRQLALFNPALIDLTALPADFLSARPNLLSFFDRLRDQRMMPEPKNYGSWRHQIADLVAAAADGRYQETWTLPSGAVYSVSGRPHPDGAIAFLFEDITAEITLTRRFRTDLEISQSMLDQLDNAIAVFSENGALSFSNAAYRRMWNVDPDASFVQMTVMDATRSWQNLCQATPVLDEVREFVALRDNRAEWWGQVQLRSGPTLSCGVFPISHGATMVSFTRTIPHEASVTTTPSQPSLEQTKIG